MLIELNEEERQRLALAIVETCVRETRLEVLHSGVEPHTQTGDYSDVTVSTPAGAISWNELSRISNDEMRALMIEVVNRVYTFLGAPDDLIALRAAAGWNRPQLDPALDSVLRRRQLMREGYSLAEAMAVHPPGGLAAEPSTPPAPVAPAPSPDQLRDLAAAAEVSPAWVHRASQALMTAASEWESTQFDAMDASEAAWLAET